MAHGGYARRRLVERRPVGRRSKGLGLDKRRNKSKRVSLKNQIRSTERLLRKDLPDEVRKTQEKKLEELKQQQELQIHIALEHKIRLRDKKIKFFERRKIERMIRRLEKQQRASSDHVSDERILYQLSKLKEDLNYVRFFPKTEKYVSLFVGGDNPAIAEKRNKLREQIKANLIAAAANGRDLEETASDDDALDVSEDDFFLSGSSSDEAEADDEWTDRRSQSGPSRLAGRRRMETLVFAAHCRNNPAASDLLIRPRPLQRRSSSSPFCDTSPKPVNRLQYLNFVTRPSSSILRKSPTPYPLSCSRLLRPLNCSTHGFADHGVDHRHSDNHHDHEHQLDHDHENRHDHHHHYHHHHHHHHGHGHGHGYGVPNRVQKAILHFAKAIGWVDLADLLREHLQLCCCSMALLLLAAACPYVLPGRTVKPLQNALIAVAFPLVGVSAALDAIVNIASGKVNIHVLMALAAFASVFMGNSLEGGLLLAMFNLAHIAEEYFTSRSMIDVKELKENYPDCALLLEVNGDAPQFTKLNYTKVPVCDLEVGSYILVRAGEAVPVDGEVFQGASTITIEHLTGETKPLERRVGDAVPGGARNLEGMLIVKVTKSWEDSTINKIVELTKEGQLNKPRLERWLDEFGEYYSKVVVALSLGIALLGPFIFKWPFIGNSVSRGSVYRALGLMVAASPCALAVAPLAYATAISACARKGILLKGGHVFDALAACKSIAFDKTGTLTTGKLMCKAIEPIHGHWLGRNKSDVSLCCTPNCESEALAVAAAMEKGTTHPIGRALVDHSLGKELPDIFIHSFECLPGRGLFATLTGIKSGMEQDLSKASLGSIEYIASLCNSTNESKKIKEAVRTSAYGSDFVQAALSINKKVTLFHFEDEPRPGVAEVISTLKDKAKLRIMMLTGDHELSASRVAKIVGINEVYYCLKPEEKLNRVKTTARDRGGGLIMVGDGINDAPALAAATVGIVLAQRASATATAVADVLLLHDNISNVPFCIAKARQTTSLVKQSVALALSCIIFASLPSVLGYLPLWLTVLLHEGGTLLVCLNSVRALNDPTWSWKEDLLQLLRGLKKALDDLLKRRPSWNSTTIQPSAG